VVDSIELGEVLASLQAQINAFRCGDDVLHEGYWYNTTSIGGQCWFAENVRYLPEVSSSAVSDVDPHAYVQYYIQGTDVSEAQNTSFYHKFGALYNFPAVEQWNLCPGGWHVPTDLEWTEMTNSLGSSQFAGDLMKATYFCDAYDGSNLSGFSGLPGGYKKANGGFGEFGSSGYWWSSSPNGSDAWYRHLNFISDAEDVLRDGGNQRLGFSVRCVRDAE
jgi:uncharacterized protein (TIGR02145 family)